MKKLLSVLLALCMVISMVTVAAVSVGAAEVGAGAATGASARTIYVGVVTYLNLNANNYQVHYWGGSDGAKDAALTATGKTVQQAVGSAYWSNQPKTFNMYTASIPADATGFKVHNGDTWFGTDGNTAQNNTAYVFEYGGNYNAYYTTTQEQEEPTQPATDAPEQRPYTMYVDLTDVLGEGGSNWYAWTWQDGKEGEWVNIEKFGYVSVYKNVVFASFNVTPPNWNNVVSQTVDIVVEDGNTLYVLNEKENNKFKVKWKTEPATDEPTEPATDEPGTEPETQPATDEPTQPATDEPTQPATADPSVKGAYYIIGTMTGWAVDDAYKLTANEASEGEYMFLGLELAADDQFKVVYSEDGSVATTWYPDGTGNNYGENGEITAAGTYDVYFRPDGQGGEDWFYNVMFVAAQEQPGTEPETQPGTEPESQPATEPETQPETQSGTEAEVTEIELDGDYYLVGYIGGADYNGTDYKFTEGKLTATFAETSYVCIKNTDGDWYMTNGFDPEATEAILYKADSENNEKLMVPAGKATFTLKAYSDGTYKLSYVTEEITPDESSQPGSDAPADTITVKFTDAMFYGDVNVYFWPNGGDWPGKAMTEVDINDFNQKIYTAEIPADVEGIIFNGNGRQTVDILKDITDGAWWYTVEKTDEAGHNYVELVSDEDPTDEPGTEPETQPATDEPTQPATADPSAKGAYYIVGTMNGWAVDDAYKLTANEASEGEYMFLGLELAADDEFKVVYSEDGSAATTWYPDGSGNNYGENGEIKADGTYDVYFRPDGQGGEDWFYNVLYVAAQEEPGTEPETQPGTDEPAEGAYYIVGTMTEWAVDDAYKLTANEASEGEYMFLGLELAADDQFKVVYSEDGSVATTWYPDGSGNNYGENGEIKAAGTYDVYFRPDGQGGEDWFYNVLYVAAQEEPSTEPGTEPETQPETQSGTEAEVTEIELDGDFFLVGYIGGADYNGTDYKFTEGKLTATFADTSYVCIKNADGDWYMTSGFDPEATEAILYKADSENNEKLMVPAGKATFTLKAYSDGTYKLSYVTEEITTDEPTEPDETTEPIVGEGAYYIIGTMTEWSINEDYKLTANEASEGEYMFLGLELAADDQFKVVYFNAGILGGGMVWYPDGSGNNYGENGEITAAGTYDVYFRPDGQGGEDWFYNVMYVAAQGEPGTEPESQPGTEPETQPETDTPAEGAYYIVGTMNGWAVDDAYKLTANEASEGEYMFTGLELAADDQFKVVYSEDGSEATTWYPDGTGNNYGENGEITAAGTYDVYFRPDGQGGEDWFYGVMYVAAQEQPTEEPTEPTEPATDAPVTEIELDGDFFLVGYIGGADYNGNDYKFTEGKLTATFADTSYVCIKNADGDWYMTSGFDPEATEAILYKADSENNEKLMVPAGKATFTLKAYSDGTYKLSYVTEEITTDEPTEPDETTEPVVGAGAYYIVGTMNDWTPADEYKLTANEASEGEYMFTGLELAADDQFKVVYSEDGSVATTWYPDGMGNNYGENGEIKADGTYDVYFRPDGQGGEDWFYGVMYVAAQEQPTEPATDEPTEPATDEPTEPDETTEPVVGAGAYYIVGTMNDWTPADEYKLTANEASEGEYMFTGLELAADDQFKVVYSEDGSDATTWYPDGMGNNYGENGEITADGTYDVYFRPDGQGGEDWFYGVMYVVAQEQPTEPATDEPTEPTEPGTEPTEPDETTEPTEPGEEDTVIVAGSEPEIFGTGWDATNEDNLMTKQADGTYTREYTVEKAYDAVQLKAVVNGAEWIGDLTGNNVTFNLKDAGTFTVIYHPAVGEDPAYVEVTGDIVEFITEFTYNTVYAAGNGEGYWLNGAAWDPAYAANEMTEIADDVWEITFENVPDGFERQIKFAIDGAWTYNFGGVFEASGVETVADFNGNNITFDTDDICTVKAQLDLTGFDFTTKTGAKFTITIIYEDEPLLGDIDGDGEVTINDATMLQRYFAEFIDLTDDQLAVADVNEDGKVNIRDVTAIQRMVAEF